MPLIAERLCDRSKKVRSTVATSWVLGKFAVDMPPGKLAEALEREDHPEIREAMQALLIHVVKERGENK